MLYFPSFNVIFEFYRKTLRSSLAKKIWKYVSTVLYNKWIPKSIQTVMDFNQVSDFEQKAKKDRKKCYNTSFSKMTQHWSMNRIKTR